MAATFVIACPECSKQVKVSEEHVGKKIRCKGCQHVFPVRAPGGPPPPAAKKATAAKPKAAAPPEPPEPVEGDEDFKYVLAQTDDTIARCPFCAMQLESNDARICLNCGYDTVKRQRPEVKQVYAHTAGELFLWWLPAIMCILLMIGSIVWYLFFWNLIEGWLEDSFLEDEKGPPPTYYAAASPGFFRLYHAILIVFIWVPLVRFTYKRLFVYNKPPDKRMKDEFGNPM